MTNSKIKWCTSGSAHWRDTRHAKLEGCLDRPNHHIVRVLCSLPLCACNLKLHKKGQDEQLRQPTIAHSTAKNEVASEKVPWTHPNGKGNLQFYRNTLQAYRFLEQTQICTGNPQLQTNTFQAHKFWSHQMCSSNVQASLIPIPYTGLPGSERSLEQFQIWSADLVMILNAILSMALDLTHVEIVFGISDPFLSLVSRT